MPRCQPQKRHPVMDRLREATGKSDLQLAGMLGMDPKGVYESRKNNSVPYRHIVVAVKAKVLPVDLHWLFTGSAFCEAFPVNDPPLDDASRELLASRNFYEALVA